MSIRRGNRQSRGRSRQPHDAVARLVQEMITERIERVLPRLGTVVGTDNDGSPRVRIDDESTARSVGLPATRGQKYSEGQRVLLVPTGEDRYVMTGEVAVNGETKITNADVADNLVTPSKIDISSVANNKEVARGNLLVTEGFVATQYTDSSSKPASIAAVQQGVETRMKPPSGSSETSLGAYVQGTVDDKNNSPATKLITKAALGAYALTTFVRETFLAKATSDTITYTGNARDADLVKELRKVRGKGVLKIVCPDNTVSASRCWIEGG
jgi:hypothetical protein